MIEMVNVMLKITVIIKMRSKYKSDVEFCSPADYCEDYM